MRVRFAFRSPALPLKDTKRLASTTSAITQHDSTGNHDLTYLVFELLTFSISEAAEPP
jgi:hypothetical protein